MAKETYEMMITFTDKGAIFSGVHENVEFLHNEIGICDDFEEALYLFCQEAYQTMIDKLTRRALLDYLAEMDLNKVAEDIKQRQDNEKILDDLDKPEEKASEFPWPEE